MTSIEWTQRPGTKGETWNPLAGCTIVSPGCSHCYAMRMGHRIQAMGGKGAETYAGTTRVVNGHPVWTGKVNAAPEETLLKPLRWREPRTVFVNSMSDLFHEDVPDEVIDRVFAIMALTPQHTYQVLTKRSARMREYFTTPYRPGKFISILDDGSLIDTGAASVRARSAMCDLFPRTPPRALNDAIAWQDQHYPDGDGFMRRWPLPNVWLGVSAERRDEWLPRTADLRETPAAVRFVSAEPLLSDLGEIDLAGLQWIIVGGESGPGARPMHPAWARSIRDQCAAAGTAFFFKQWGGYRPLTMAEHGQACGAILIDGCDPHDPDSYMLRVAKRAAGRLLDGREHSAYPPPFTGGPKDGRDERLAPAGDREAVEGAR